MRTAKLLSPSQTRPVKAFGWTTHGLLHPVPEQPAANYSRLSRVDDMGLIWLLRGRPVTVLTSTEAIIRCHSGATLRYGRIGPAPAEIVTVAPATAIGDVTQIVKPTLQIVDDAAEAAEIDKGATA